MRIITTVASLHGQSAEHYKMCVSLGPVAHVEVKAESNVAAARNRCLTAVARHLDWDVCLMLDDDVFMSPNDARDLCGYAMIRKRPVSALYPTSAGDVRIRFAVDPEEPREALQLTGLGALAIPREVLIRRAEGLRYLDVQNGKLLQAFTKSAPAPCGTEWWNEDAWLCYGLGGVEISKSYTAKHLKGRMLELSEQAHIDMLEQIQQAKLLFLDKEHSRQ